MSRDASNRAASSPFAFLDRPTGAPALIDAAAGRVWSQDELGSAVQHLAGGLASDRRELVFCLCRTDVSSVIGYLAAVRAGHAVALLDRDVSSDLMRALVDRYRPTFILHPDDAPTPRVEQPLQRSETEPSGRLAVLLSTSGTTGSPKFVRLSRENLDANAAAIVQYLEIDEQERAIQSLPMHYSYGLSVLNTHLAAGASVIISPHSLMRPEFWADAARFGATSFAGVPHSYAILERTGLLDQAMPDTMRTLTQAGGRLAPDSAIALHRLMSKRGGRLWVMYGQTEATARISYVPHEALPDKAHTIGIPIPGGELEVSSGTQRITERDVEGELVYRGPNVMLGYANGPADLALGDLLHGELRTGDLGAFDADGFFRLTGRRKRIAKIYGLRVNLDEVEAAAGAHGPVAAVSCGERILLWRPADQGVAADDLRREIAHRFRLNSNALLVRDIDELPLKGSGKIDYDRLATLGAS